MIDPEKESGFTELPESWWMVYVGCPLGAGLFLEMLFGGGGIAFVGRENMKKYPKSKQNMFLFGEI